MKDQTQISIIADRLKENIRRLEVTINLNSWQSGYVATLENQIAACRQKLKELEATA